MNRFSDHAGATLMLVLAMLLAVALFATDLAFAI